MLLAAINKGNFKEERDFKLDLEKHAKFEENKAGKMSILATVWTCRWKSAYNCGARSRNFV